MTPFDIFPPVTRLTMLVVAAGIGLRLIGIRLRGSRYPLVRWPGWTASSLTAWMAASMFGAWSPAWIALLGGVAALVRPEWVRRHPGFVSVVDAAILLLGFGLSVGGRSTATALFVSVLLVGTLALFDAIVRRLDRIGRGPVFERDPAPARRSDADGGSVSGAESELDGSAAPAIGSLPPGWLASMLAVLGVVPIIALGDRLTGYTYDELVPPSRVLPMFIGFAPRCVGTPLWLSGGTRAWLDVTAPEPDEGEPVRSTGAVLFHGADPRASLQPGACAIRRALQEAGFTVLSVDHPGFGESRAPGGDDPVEAWDYLPAARAGAELLIEQGLADRVILVGHSMGASTVLRLAADPPPGALGGVILGPTVGDPDTQEEDETLERFHRDRRLQDTLSREDWRAVIDRYYDLRDILASMPDTSDAGFPIAHGDFAVEWPAIVEERDELFAMLPEPKQRFTLPSSHSLSTSLAGELLIGDPRGARALARIVDTLEREWREDAGDGPP